MALSSAIACPLAAVAADEEETPPATSDTPIRDSVDGIVDRYFEERTEPCKTLQDSSRPCFPSEVVKQAPDASVEESLPDVGSRTAPSPDRPPTRAELERYRSGLLSASGTLGSIDPICSAKSTIKKLKGKNDTYFLYRITDALGDHIELRDRRLDPAAYWGVAEFRFELLEEIHGECRAVAAYRRYLRDESADDDAEGPSP
jgi:hypothetical protein